MKSLEGKVALVTGGSSGIGRAAGMLFSREDAKVVIADVDVKGGEETGRINGSRNPTACKRMG